MHNLASNNKHSHGVEEVKLKILLYYSGLQVGFHSHNCQQ